MCQNAFRLPIWARLVPAWRLLLEPHTEAYPSSENDYLMLFVTCSDVVNHFHRQVLFASRWRTANPFSNTGRWEGRQTDRQTGQTVTLPLDSGLRILTRRLSLHSGTEGVMQSAAKQREEGNKLPLKAESQPQTSSLSLVPSDWSVILFSNGVIKWQIHLHTCSEVGLPRQ